VRALVHRRAVTHVDEQVQGNISDPSSLNRAVANVDAIVHLASRTHARSARAYDEINVYGTQDLSAAVANAGSPFLLHVSTRAISPAGGSYSRSKLQAEEIVRSKLPRAAIVRLPEVYGGAGREGVDRIIDDARQGKRVIVVRGDFEVRPVFIEDAVNALVSALANDRCQGQTYTLAGERFTMRSFAEQCVRILSSQSAVVCVPPPLIAALRLAARVVPLPLYPDQLQRLRSPKPDASPNATSDLGFAPRPLHEGLLVSSGVGSAATE
jgi:NADH dehydrogenase